MVVVIPVSSDKSVLTGIFYSKLLLDTPKSQADVDFAFGNRFCEASILQVVAYLVG